MDGEKQKLGRSRLRPHLNQMMKFQPPSFFRMLRVAGGRAVVGTRQAAAARASRVTWTKGAAHPGLQQKLAHAGRVGAG